MSQRGNSERIGFLRETIARLEMERAPASGVAPGELCEILPARPADAAAACGFAISLARRAAGNRGAIIWVAEDFVLAERGFPHAPGFSELGLDPNRFVMVRATGARQVLWTLEESLRSPACAVAIGEIQDADRHCDLTATRRLTVAARSSGAQGILLHGRPVPGDLSTAAQRRFEIRSTPGPSLPSAGGRRPIPDMPAWGVRVLKARAGAGQAGLADPDHVQAFVAGLPVADPPLIPPRPALRRRG